MKNHLYASLFIVILCFLLCPYPSQAALDCLMAPHVDCGQVVHGSTVGLPNNASAYGSCGIPGSYWQGEQIWKFNNQSLQDISVTLDGEMWMSVFVLSRCDPAACIGSGAVYMLPAKVQLPSLQPGTYIIVVDGSMSSGDYNLSITCGGGMDCSNARPLRCGDTVQGTTLSGQNKTFAYNCARHVALDGQEVIYEFDLNRTTDVVFSLDDLVLPNPFASLTMLLLDDCNSSNCLSFTTAGNMGASLPFGQMPPGTYYLVIDSVEGVASPYTLSVNCSELDCASAMPINCNDKLQTSNRGKPNNVVGYECFPYFTFGGGEAIYTFTLSQPSDIYVRIHDIYLLGNVNTLFMFLLDGCNISSCLQYCYGQTGGSAQILGQALPAGQYYLVVDGTDGAEGDYKLDFYCGDLASPQTMDIIRCNGRRFPDVELTVSVADRVGRFVHGLTPQDFEITEDGQLQTITSVDEYQCGSGIEVSVALVMDCSGSMDGVPMIEAIYAAHQFVNLLAPNDRACIISFDNFVTVHQAMTSDKRALSDALNRIQTGGGTAMFDGVYEGITQCIPETNSKAVFVFTDGGDNASAHTPSETIDYALANGIPVYTIEIASSGSATLQHLAYATGGVYESAPSAADLAQIYNSFYHNLKSNYIINYTSNNPQPDMTTRQVSLCIPGSNLCDDADYLAASCAWFTNDTNSSVEMTLTQDQVVGQQFLNHYFQGPVRDLEVELFFNNIDVTEVAVSWWDDDNDTPGQKLSDADQGISVIECPGWYAFSFIQNPLIIQPNTRYWVVVENKSNGASLIPANQLIGPDGGVINGRNNGGQVSWQQFNPDMDIYLRVYGCAVKPSPTPTPTFTPGGPTVTPTLPPQRPVCLMAGYMNTHLTAQAGGTMTFLAIAATPDPVSIAYGELYFNQSPTGVIIPVTGYSGQYTLLQYTLDLPAGVSPMQLEFDLSLRDVRGLQSHFWPFLNVE